MSTTHTQGKWSYSRHLSTFEVRANGQKLAHVGVIGNKAGVEEAEANARLIAAAPDMLQTLEAVREYLHHDTYAYSEKMIEQIDEVINRATKP